LKLKKIDLKVKIIFCNFEIWRGASFFSVRLGLQNLNPTLVAMCFVGLHSLEDERLWPSVYFV